jgi:hypothetical protein
MQTTPHAQCTQSKSTGKGILCDFDCQSNSNGHQHRCQEGWQDKVRKNASTALCKQIGLALRQHWKQLPGITNITLIVRPYYPIIRMSLLWPWYVASTPLTGEPQPRHLAGDPHCTGWQRTWSTSCCTGPAAHTSAHTPPPSLSSSPRSPVGSPGDVQGEAWYSHIHLVCCNFMAALHSSAGVKPCAAIHAHHVAGVTADTTYHEWHPRCRAAQVVLNKQLGKWRWQRVCCGNKDRRKD